MVPLCMCVCEENREREKWFVSSARLDAQNLSAKCIKYFNEGFKLTYCTKPLAKPSLLKYPGR